MGHNLTFPVYWTAIKVADVSVYGLSCPIKKSRSTTPINFDITLAKIDIPGFSDFTVTINAKDANDEDLLCAVVHGYIQLKDEQLPLGLGDNQQTLAPASRGNAASSNEMLV